MIGWQQLHRYNTSLGNMTVTETVKEIVKGASATSDEPRESYPILNLPYSFGRLKVWTAEKPSELMLIEWPPSPIARVTREQMSEAKLPLAYRDSCAHLLIPLNRCRFEEYYMPWKCVVCCDCYAERT